MSERTALRLGALLALLWAAVALLAVHPEAIGLFHDDGIYLATAKSIAEGEGYRLAHLPGAPHQTKYPPLWPALLALVWKLAPEFPGNVPHFKALGIALWALVLPAVQRLALRAAGLSPAVSLAVVALLAASPLALASANFALSEPLFALLSTLSVLALAEPRETSPSRAATIGGGTLAALALLTRTQGVGLLVAIGGAAASGRSRCRGALALAPGLAAAGAWWGWVAAHRPPAASALLEPYVSYRSTLLSGGGGIRASTLFAFVRERAIDVPRALGELLGAGSGALAVGVGLAALALAGAGAVRLARAGGRLLALHAATSVLLAAAVPWPPRRFLLPVLGVLAVLAAAGAVALGGGPGRVVRARVVAGAAAALVVAGAARSAGEVAALDRASVPLPIALSSGRGDWAGYLECAAWLASGVPREEVVASAHDPFYFLFSGRRGVRFWRWAPSEIPVARAASREPDLGEPGELLSEYRRLGVRWLLLERAGAEFAAGGAPALALGRTIVAMPAARARRAFRSADGEHELWRLDPEPPAPSGAAAR